jgi:hypothetical protein
MPLDNLVRSFQSLVVEHGNISARACYNDLDATTQDQREAKVRVVAFARTTQSLATSTMYPQYNIIRTPTAMNSSSLTTSAWWMCLGNGQKRSSPRAFRDVIWTRSLFGVVGIRCRLDKRNHRCGGETHEQEASTIEGWETNSEAAQGIGRNGNTWSRWRRRLLLHLVDDSVDFLGQS